ncbi:MAG: hypothetical protein ACJ790_12125 [Myxococcaceae bacterium]
MRNRKLIVAASLMAVVVSACQCGRPGGPEEETEADGGGKRDGGNLLPDGGVRPDAGHTSDGGIPYTSYTFPEGTAYEPCTTDTEGRAADGGMPNPDVYLPLCIALRKVDGFAQLNGAPVQQSVHWSAEATGYGSDYDDGTDGGLYSFKVLRGDYTHFKWHPSDIYPTHQGPIDTGAISLLSNVHRDLAVTAHWLSGRLTFGGIPWISSTNPPDLTVNAASFATPQSASTSTANGNYNVRLIEGTYQLAIDVPKEALGSTELAGYPLTGITNLQADTTVSQDLPVSLLTGSLLIDGEPIPNIVSTGPDYYLEYDLNGAPVVATTHEGADGNLRAVVPSNTYAVSFGFSALPNRTLPDQLINKQLSASLNLAQDRTQNWNLSTVHWEGALLVDGQPVPGQAGTVWTLYAYGYDSGPNDPWFVAYYDVPFDQASFNLRMFPKTYFLELYIDERFHPDLMAGWYIYDRQKDIVTNTSGVINVDTGELFGTLNIDGQPASNVNSAVGTLVLSGAEGSFSRKLETTDGTFHVRVPKGTYDIAFVINQDAYPEYASGRYTLQKSVNLSSRQNVTLNYNTVRVAGPLAVDNALVPNTSLSTNELSLVIAPSIGNGTWHKKLEGGQSWYSFRIPEGDWDVDVQIEEQALPNTAWGSAPYVYGFPIRPVQQ